MAPHYSSYAQLVQTVQGINFDADRRRAPSSHPMKLSVELCERVAQYFVILPVSMEHVVATGCSSQQLDAISGNTPLMPLAACLTEDETTWWISGEGLDIRPQYVEFNLTAPVSSVCQLRAVSIKIRPLPYGPLSVRHFVLQTDADDDDMSTAISSRQYIVANRTGFQRFALDQPADVASVRVVCLSNQIRPFSWASAWADAALVQHQQQQQQQQVGFNSVKFE
jgi:hypothetical protein